MIELAAESGHQGALAEAFFRAYFMEGRDLSVDQTLRDIATGQRIAEGLIDAVLTEESVTRIVAAADAEMGEYGVSGVPLFIIGNTSGKRLAVSGVKLNAPPRRRVSVASWQAPETGSPARSP